MPSARDHPFNQSRRPLLEGGGQPGSRHLAHDDEEEDDADYEDIRNNNTSPTTNGTSSDIRCDFKTYGFVRKFTKAPAIASSSYNEKSRNNNIYNGFNDFNAIPRATGEDGVGYPYGEKIINEKQPIAGTFREPRDGDFIFTADQQHNKMYLNNHLQQQSHYQHPATLPRKLNNNQHVNHLYNNHQFNHNNQQNNGGTRIEPDFANRPLPQTPTSVSATTTPLLARQRPVAGQVVGVVAPRAVCPTPPLCRANRKGPFIFGVDNQNHHHMRQNSNSSNSSPAGSPLQRRPPPVIEQWKYSENNNSPDLTAIRRRDVYQRTQTAAVQVRPSAVCICFNQIHNLIAEVRPFAGFGDQGRWDKTVNYTLICNYRIKKYVAVVRMMMIHTGDGELI